MITSPALRYHGGKFRLAPWIIEHFPPHKCYVEAFGGAAGVLLQKKRSYAEVYNDLDSHVVNFFKVLRDPDMCARLVDLFYKTPYARAEFNDAWQNSPDMVENARRMAVRALMGFGSGGATKSTTGFRCDTKRNGSNAQHVWAKYPQNIATVAQRFAGVLIENRPAIDVMQAHDTPETLHYVDPPYMHNTRTSTCKVYRYEMSIEEHSGLLDALMSLAGMVVLSGYDSGLYTQKLKGWAVYKKQSAASGRLGTVMRTEYLYLNPCAEAALNKNKNNNQYLLIAGDV